MGVAIRNRQRRVAVSRPLLARAAARALAAAGRPAGEVEIDVVDDREIRRLNHRFRGVGRRTDVLAFPLEIPDATLVGQIVISAETAARQARAVGVSLGVELALLATHGVLHLIGYDDRDPVEADLMHRRERDILSSGRRRPPENLWRGLLLPERGLRPRNPVGSSGGGYRAGEPEGASAPSVAKPALAPPDFK